MQIFEQKYVVKHKPVQPIHKKRTPCYKQIANNGVGFARSMSQMSALLFHYRYTTDIVPI